MNRPLSIPITEHQRRAFQAARRWEPIFRARDVLRLSRSLPDTRTPELVRRYNQALMASALRADEYRRDRSWLAFCRRLRPQPINLLHFGRAPA